MNKNNQKIKRKTRVRSKIHGTSSRPRLSVFRSNKYIYAQLIDDDKRTTIFGISQKKLKASNKVKPVENSRQLGIELAKAAQDKKIKEVVFDRGAYIYHGRIKAFAEGAREGGLKF